MRKLKGRWVDDARIRGRSIFHIVNPKHYLVIAGIGLMFAEQHCIVAKVDELLTHCDELEAQFTTFATARRQFLNATLHDALAIRRDLEPQTV